MATIIDTHYPATTRHNCMVEIRGDIVYKLPCLHNIPKIE